MYPSRLILCSCNKIEYIINLNVAMLYELQCCKFYLRPICIETVEMFIKLLKHNALHTSIKQTTVPTPSQDSLIKHSLPLHPPFLFQGWFGCLETNIRGRLKLRSLQWFNSIKVKEHAGLLLCLAHWIHSTGSVYKGQGRKQQHLMTGAY